MIKRAVIAFVTFIFIFALTDTVFAENDFSWKWVYSDSHSNYYVDTANVRYTKSHNTVSYWCKIVASNGDEYVVREMIDLNHRMAAVLALSKNKAGEKPEPRYFGGDLPLYRVLKGSPREKEVNVICDELHLPHIEGYDKK